MLVSEQLAKARAIMLERGVPDSGRRWLRLDDCVCPLEALALAAGLPKAAWANDLVDTAPVRTLVAVLRERGPVYTPMGDDGAVWTWFDQSKPGLAETLAVFDEAIRLALNEESA